MKYKKTIIYVLPLLFIVLGLIFILSYNIELSKICSNSMYPTYKKGEYILFCTYANLKKVKRFNIVFFKQNDNLHVKRIIGLPGDEITFLNNGININNKKLKIPQKIKIIYDKENESKNNNIKFIVPQNSFFVIGDNLPGSLDSRFYGSIPQSIIYGSPIINLGQE